MCIRDRSITVGVSCLVASIRAQWRSHLPRFWNAHRASWSVSLVFISRRMMPVGAFLWGRHPWAALQRPETVCRLRCFAAVGRHYSGRWFRLPLFPRYSGKRQHEISCPGVGCAGNDACPEGSFFAYITRLIPSAKALSLS